MLAIAMNFIIFGGASFNIFGNIIEDLIDLTLCSDIYVTSVYSEYDLPHEKMANYLDEERSKDDAIVMNYAFSGQ